MEEIDAWIYIWENIKKQEKPTKMKEYELLKETFHRDEETLLKDVNHQMFRPYHEF